MSRTSELAGFLDCQEEDLKASEYDENVFVVNSRLEKAGNPPQRYIDIIAKFKILLTEKKTEQIRDFILSKDGKEQRDKLYYTVKNYIETYQKNTDEYKELKEHATHVLNVLYHLLSDEDADHVTQYKRAFLGEPIEDNRKLRQVDDGEYMVLTDEEADARAKEYIESSAWAFAPWFILQHSDLPIEALDMIKGFSEEKCEGANETILALITDFDAFVEEAISLDGRGHFLSFYDGDEHETENYYIYRTN